MEHEVVESLVRNLPNDLAEYVMEDNRLFREEIKKWDVAASASKKQQEVRDLGVELPTNEASNDVQVSSPIKLESRKMQLTLNLLTVPFVISLFLNQVVQEKLTYVNTHAKLSTQMSSQIIELVERKRNSRDEIASIKDGYSNLMDEIVDETHKAYSDLITKCNEEGSCVDCRLQSFVIYLMKNQCSRILIRLALLEQFSLPGLDNMRHVMLQFLSISALRLLKVASNE